MVEKVDLQVRLNDPRTLMTFCHLKDDPIFHAAFGEKCEELLYLRIVIFRPGRHQEILSIEDAIAEISPNTHTQKKRIIKKKIKVTSLVTTVLNQLIDIITSIPLWFS